MILLVSLKKYLFGILTIIYVMAISNAAFCANGVKLNSDDEAQNIGFIKNPPKELKEKFPMCEEFLKVTWIDKQKNIGYSYVDFYSEQGEKVIKNNMVLIDIDKTYPRFDYDLNQYQKNGRLNKVFNLIRQGYIQFNTSYLSIESMGAKKFQVDFSLVEDVKEQHDISLSRNLRNVCVPFSNNKRMWIGETRQLGRTSTTKEILQISDKLKVENADTSSLSVSANLDLNFDGIEDYFSADHIIYSINGAYAEAKCLGQCNEYHFSFPPKNEICSVVTAGNFYLTSDGKSYFLNNLCNLTRLTGGN